MMPRPSRLPRFPRFPSALLLATLLSPSSPAMAAPLAAAPTKPPALQNCLQRAKAVATSTQAELEKAFAAVGLQKNSWGISARQLVAARKAKIDETRLLGWTRGVFAESLCQASSRSGWKENGRWQARLLLSLLGELGSPKSYPLLTRLAARGAYNAEFTREAILAREAMARAKRFACQPPSSAEVLRARGAVADLLLVQPRGRTLRLRPPTRRELGDLAYFYAAVGDAGPEVGAADDSSVFAVLRSRAQRFGPQKTALAKAAAQRAMARVKTERKQLKQQQDALYARLHRALMDGDLATAQTVGVEYLATVGYPWVLQARREQVWAWGGARYSYVLRDLAMVAELRGEWAFAAELYRLANPGGGMCGTGTSGRWLKQLRGAIRSAESAGRCREALPERLLETKRGLTYGTQRLAQAGFDVTRLLRGALLMLHRDLPLKELKAIAKQSGARLEQRFLARLQKRGKEAWEVRVKAIEGLADHTGKAAVDALAAIARRAAPATRLRALAALTKLVVRPEQDPCKPRGFSMGFGGGSNVWSRQIRRAGRSCKTSLRPKQTQRLLRAMLPLARDPNPEIREHVAKVLGALALPGTRATLKRLARDPYKNPNVCRMQSVPQSKGSKAKPGGKPKTRCVPIPIVAEAASEALTRLKKFAGK